MATLYDSTEIDLVTVTNDGFIKLNVAYWEQILTSVMIGLIAIVGLVGNSMIIIAVVFSRKLQTSTNVFVTSLAVTDLIASFFMIPYMVGVLGRDAWPIPQAEWLCVVTGYMIYACTWTNVWTLAAIAVNRLLLITKPYLYHTIYTSQRLFLIVAILWLVPVIVLVVLMVTSVGQFGYDPADLACAALNTPEMDFSFSLILFLVGLPIPLLVIIIGYVWIYVHLKKYFRAKKRRLTVQYIYGSSSMGPATSHECVSPTIKSQDFSTHNDGTVATISTHIPQDCHSSEHHLSTVDNKIEEPVANNNSPTALTSDDDIFDMEGNHSGIAEASSNKRNTATSSRISTTHRRASREKISNQQIEITKNLFVVVCTFTICFVPFFVFYYISGHILFYARVMIFASSALNFVIYALKHPDFKVVFGHMIRCSCSNIPQPSECLKCLLKN